jgi:hypothetical protein
MAKETPQEILKKMLYSLRKVSMPCVICQENTLRKIIYQPTERTKLIIGMPEENYVRIPIVGFCEAHDPEDEATIIEAEKAILNQIRNKKNVLRLKDGKPYEETDKEHLPEV